MQGSSYSDEDRARAVMVYAITGNARAVERQINIPNETVCYWTKQGWWQDMITQAYAEKSKEIDAMWTGILHRTSEEVLDRVENGDSVQYGIDEEGKPLFVRKPMSGKDLCVTMGIVYDKRALQRGDPTSRTERVGTDELLDKLAKKMEAMAKQGAITAERVDEQP